MLTPTWGDMRQVPVNAVSRNHSRQSPWASGFTRERTPTSKEAALRRDSTRGGLDARASAAPPLSHGKASPPSFSLQGLDSRLAPMRSNEPGSRLEARGFMCQPLAQEWPSFCIKSAGLTACRASANGLVALSTFNRAQSKTWRGCDTAATSIAHRHCHSRPRHLRMRKAKLVL